MADHPALPDAPLLLVLVRCNEPYATVVQQLRAARLPYIIYQKEGGMCNKRRLPESEAASSRLIPFNLGRECVGYVKFISDYYHELPRMTAFLQWEAEMHMPLRGHGLPANVAFLRNVSSGYVALSKNVFEGPWPAPCEPAKSIPAFASCSASYWQEAASAGAQAGAPPPDRVRFYANGMFAASADRIRRHPRAFYRRLLARFSGRTPLRCVDGNVFRPFHNRNASGVVRSEVDCLVLEKLWHVLLGEPPMMPPPAEYDQLRFPPSYLATVGSLPGASRKRVARPLTGQQTCAPNCDWAGKCWSEAHNRKLVESGEAARRSER